MVKVGINEKEQIVILSDNVHEMILTSDEAWNLGTTLHEAVKELIEYKFR